jgi:predicted ATPase
MGRLVLVSKEKGKNIMEKEAESNFKLLAIRTGSKLTKEEIQSFENFPYVNNSRFVPAHYDYLKNLKPNETFLLFNDFSIDKNGNTLTHIPEKSIPNIYTFKNSETKLSVSSIVGKNGSGKSTLLEILYLAIHNLAVATEVLYDSNIVKVEDPQKYLRCELYILTDENTSYKIKFDDKALKPCEISKAIRDNNKFEYQKPKPFNKTILGELFYSIAVNYSIYGLNSKHLGSWITHLFHKNDSYQTPLVINPMRTDGNFDINNEEYLSKYRLLSNSIIKYKKHRKSITVIDNIRLKNLLFKFDKRKIANLESRRVFKQSNSSESEEKTKSIQELIEKSQLDKNASEIATLAVKIILKKKISSQHIEYKEETEKYIVKKLYRIAFNYRKYWDYLEYPNSEQLNLPPVLFETNFNKTVFENYLEELKKDNTHITLKLRQALNYLVNNPLSETTSSDGKTTYNFKEIIGAKIYDIPFTEFAKKLLTYDDNVIHCIPPSLFDIAVIVSDESKKDKESFNLNHLSSGQLQLIQSIQSSLYHINNLESYKTLVKEDDRIKYKNVLILFDEVELYFHPDYQRKIINFFIKQLDELSFSQIKSIHVVYITHSPFILSDIPSTNILMLDEGAPKDEKHKSFGANISDLLANSFFLEDGLIGDFAKEKINETIIWLNYKKLKKEIEILNEKSSNPKDKEILSLKNKELSILNDLVINDNIKYHKKLIYLIDEPILKTKLIEMYSEVFDIEKDYQTKELQELAEKLGYTISKKD